MMVLVSPSSSLHMLLSHCACCMETRRVMLLIALDPSCMAEAVAFICITHLCKSLNILLSFLCDPACCEQSSCCFSEIIAKFSVVFILDFLSSCLHDSMCKHVAHSVPVFRKMQRRPLPTIYRGNASAEQTSFWNKARVLLGAPPWKKTSTSSKV
jgi:hypothetical protein